MAADTLAAVDIPAVVAIRVGAGTAPEAGAVVVAVAVSETKVEWHAGFEGNPEARASSATGVMVR